MISHTELEAAGFYGKRKLAILIKQGNIMLAGNKPLKIYRLLSCSSGKRMKISNRVFFRDAREAIENGYRPCGHCLHQMYLQWKREFSAT